MANLNIEEKRIIQHFLKGVIVVCLAVYLTGCISVDIWDNNVTMDTEENTGMLAMTLSDGTRDQPGVLYVPRDYDPDEEWPLVVFLHGAGERGDDGWTHVSVGIGEEVLAHPERFPALVFMPQCPRDWAWGSRPERSRPDAGAFVDDGLEQILDKYSIDEDRISLTGLSMGGYSTFIYGAQNIDRFSALMPICGGGRVEDAGRLSTRPIRVFHGADDDVVPPERSRTMVDVIKAEGGDVSYTEFPDTDHNSWDATYRNADNIAWLLEQWRR